MKEVDKKMTSDSGAQIQNSDRKICLFKAVCTTTIMIWDEKPTGSESRERDQACRNWWVDFNA